MSLGVRGVNPIWSEVDLQGKLFDDTFYLFVLENTIPYSPTPTFHDPDLSVPWTNPIQFLGNGTLPVDIFFNPDLVYRLEFRQGPDQSYPLISEVNDYVPGSGGGSPPNTVALQSSNQVTNPQFALITFASPLTVSGTDPAPIQVAPGWFLDVAGTGSATISQVSLDDSNKNPSNAPYALRLQLSGWTTGSVFLRQRFEQNGMLWSSFPPAVKYVSSAITAQVGASSTSSGPITANLTDSNGTLLGTVLTVPTLNGSWNQYTGYAQMPATTNPDDPPAAYIDYKLAIPSNIDIYVTSIQLVSGDLPLEPTFEQDSINRQIDHTYNTAYPIVPVGAVIDFAGFTIPTHYFQCDAAAKSRITYNLLYQAITKVESVTLTSTVSTFTVASSADYYIGMHIEGTGVPAATTISNISGTTITMSAAATITGSSSVRFFAYGNGDGSTTFNLPSLADFVIAGVGGSLFGAGNNGVGASGGSATHTISIAEMPAHNHPGSTVALGQSGTGAAGAGISGTTNGPTAVSVAAQGGGSPMTIVQQTALMKKCIRYE